jgi:site-specific recombinase XerC
MTATTSLAPLLQSFFTSRLMRQKQASPHTVSSYRDTFRLLLRFLEKKLRKPPSRLLLDDVEAPSIVAFLDELEAQRGVSPRSRNLRLTAILPLCCLRVAYTRWTDSAGVGDPREAVPTNLDSVSHTARG